MRAPLRPADGSPSPLGPARRSVGVGAQAPLSCGHLRVVGNRYDAVYRVVGAVFIIAVTRAGANPFAALNLVSAVTRLLCAECKTVELTAGRIAKRYAQVRAARAWARVWGWRRRTGRRGSGPRAGPHEDAF